MGSGVLLWSNILDSGFSSQKFRSNPLLEHQGSTNYLAQKIKKKKKNQLNKKITGREHPKKYSKSKTKQKHTKKCTLKLTKRRRKEKKETRKKGTIEPIKKSINVNKH